MLGMMQNPMMQQMMSTMMSNPAFVDIMVATNPQLSAMLTANPHLRTMLSNPDMMRQSMQMASAMLGGSAAAYVGSILWYNLPLVMLPCLTPVWFALLPSPLPLLQWWWHSSSRRWHSSSSSTCTSTSCSWRTL